MLKRVVLTRVALAALCLFALTPTVDAQRSRATYANPVEAGDFPDPSVIRVGRDYWASATTSEWAPEFPILHSRDLVNWEVVGAVFQRRPEWAVGSFWAPEISQDRGRFFVYYVARKKGGSLCAAVASASKPQGPYRDHGPLVCQEVGSIDPFPVTDEQGRRYLLWKEDGNSVSKPTPIWAQQLSDDGTRLVGERKELFHNDQPWEKHPTLPYGDLVEGPTVVRRNGWFYLFYSGNFCCGRECSYAVGVARSRKLLGPWEKYTKNPIMEGNGDWRCPGHGTVVEDERGRTWFMYHAYQPKDFVYVGRQAMLDEVIWGGDGWPSINEGRGPSSVARSPYNTRDTKTELSFFDDFLSTTLKPGWQWPQANVPDFRVERAGGGWLVMSRGSEQPKDIHESVVARVTTSGDYVATTLLDPRSVKVGAIAGLSAYGDAENSVGIGVSGELVVNTWRREKGGAALTNKQSYELRRGNTAYLRMTVRDGHLYRFAVSEDRLVWNDVGGEVDGSFLPPWDRGVRVALVTTGREARFGFLRVEPSR
ncbi:MAG TPA: family 43 glycosylhydrolase [Pyrinomonadaceae bacterium]|jgi:beta-xylosidase|nr:family 43 glycosylhydrolase [Pyrinomonadaceae bacterium]